MKVSSPTKNLDLIFCNVSNKFSVNFTRMSVVQVSNHVRFAIARIVHIISLSQGFYMIFQCC